MNTITLIVGDRRRRVSGHLAVCGGEGAAPFVREIVNASLKDFPGINTPKGGLFDEAIDVSLIDGDIAPRK